MIGNWEMALRLLIACVCGGLIGIEREMHRKDAGFRTNALVCLGSCLIMMVSLEVHHLFKNEGPADPGRIAAQVVSGIGFLGAGAILRDQEGVRGLTTAAGVWVASGIGLACGLGLYIPALVCTVMTVFILIVFVKVDRVLRDRNAPPV
jgi:putative Mg2+ transporter-C (MgtC) family protein